MQKHTQRTAEFERQRRERMARYKDAPPIQASFKNGVANLCASFSQVSVHAHFKRAMTAVNAQRQACKNALRASLCTFWREVFYGRVCFCVDVLNVSGCNVVFMSSFY